MRYLVFLLAIATLPAIAFDVVVNGETVGQTDKLVIDNGRVVINTGSQSEPEPAPAPEPSPDPEPDPPGATCQNAPADVVCTEPFDWSSGESHTAFSIPQAKTLSTPFTTTSGTGFRGEITIEARSDTMPQTDMWISTTPGGSTLTTGSSLNGYYCEQEGVSFSYGLRWYQYESSRGCVLEPNTQYYLNLRHTSDSYGTSYAYRWRSNNGEPR